MHPERLNGAAVETATCAHNPGMFYRYFPGRLQGHLSPSALILLGAATALAEGNDARKPDAEGNESSARPVDATSNGSQHERAIFDLIER